MEDIPQEENFYGGNNNWSRKKSLGLGVFLIVGIIIVGFGLWQFSYRVRAPFFGRGEGFKNFKSLDQKDFEEMVAKQKKDTDNDGLTDFDEEYVYRTSPYLDDTDSDGFSDKVEIDSGNDPNCPAGKNCGIEVASGDDGSDSGNQADVSLPSSDLFLGGGATPDMVREALRQSGASEEMLAEVDDAALMEAYAEVVRETGSTEAVEELVDESEATEEVTTEEEVTVEIPGEVDLADLTPAEIRTLLLEAGVDEATLNSVDDETLLEILDEAIKEQNL